MPTYLDQKIAEALKATKGDVPAATDWLMTKCENDELLYEGLTAPLLRSAATLAIQRHLHNSRQRGAVKPTSAENQDLDPATFMSMRSTRSTPALKPLKASGAHGKSLETLVKSYTVKKPKK